MPNDKGSKVYLSKVIENKSQQETRNILRGYYTKWYKKGDYDPHNSEDTWDRVLGTSLQFNKALDIGCGPGYGIANGRKKGYSIYGMDYFASTSIWKELNLDDYCCQADASYLPFKDNIFDLVVCSDVLEHIPEFDVSRVLSEANRVGSKDFIFYIALVYDNNPVSEKYHCHITLKSVEWWANEIYRAGIRPTSAAEYSVAEDSEYSLVLITGVKDHMYQLRKEFYYGTICHS